MQKEVTDADVVKWVCGQAYAGLAPEGETPGATRGADGGGESFGVVCTLGGGEQTVRLRLPGGWDESYSDEELLGKIGETRRAQ